MMTRQLLGNELKKKKNEKRVHNKNLQQQQ